MKLKELILEKIREGKIESIEEKMFDYGLKIFKK